MPSEATGLRFESLDHDRVAALARDPASALELCSNADRIADLVSGVMASTIALYERSGSYAPWISYLAWDGNTAVGSCSFVSPPRDGEVEIAYFTFPGGEGRGHATAMAAALTLMALENGARPIAHTLPEENASTRILRKLGFFRSGVAQDDEVGEVWRWTLAPEAR